MSDRQALHVLLSDEASRGLRTFAGNHGISMSAMLEAIGQILVGPAQQVSDISEVGDRVVEKARAIDAARRARTRAPVDAAL